jgi:hypothetical protein
VKGAVDLAHAAPPQYALDPELSQEHACGQGLTRPCGTVIGLGDTEANRATARVLPIVTCFGGIDLRAQAEGGSARWYL